MGGIAIAATTAIAQSPKQLPPDYFPLPLAAYWKYQSTASAGAKSGFTLKVLAAEKQRDGSLWHQVEIESNFPIQIWYSKPKGWVMNQREAFPRNQTQVEYQPARPMLKNPLSPGDRWEWSGKGMMGAEIRESHQVAGAETIAVPAGQFTAIKVVSEVNQGGAPVKKTYGMPIRLVW